MARVCSVIVASPDMYVGEVAVFQQVDDLDQRAAHIQAERGHDLTRRQREQPDPGPGQRGGMLPAREPQRAGVQRLLM